MQANLPALSTRRPQRPTYGARPPAATVPERGAYVEVARGAASGVRGRVVERHAESVTIVATVLGQRPLLLTISLATCVAVEPAVDW